ncbi:hypothetical protein ABTD55_21400, partial [Acinetobacter baumannii]
MKKISYFSPFPSIANNNITAHGAVPLFKAMSTQRSIASLIVYSNKVAATFRKIFFVIKKKLICVFPL